MLNRERAQLLLWESLIQEETANGDRGTMERCMARLLREDPELKAFEGMSAVDQDREKFFVANSIKGYLGFLRENPNTGLWPQPKTV